MVNDLATIKDVAKLAGVSVATVSRVLNQSNNVKPETVEQVTKAIEALDYHPNFLGRTLRRLETRKILVMVPTISNQFYSRVIRGIQAAAFDHRYHVMLGISGGDSESEQQYIEMLRHRLVDGIIFLHSGMSAEEISELGADCPVVFACEQVEGARVSLVSINDYNAASEATAFLLQNGHRRIAFVSAGDLYASSKLRTKGYRDAIGQYHIPFDPHLVLPEGLTFNAGVRAAKKILQMETFPDAVFLASDTAAFSLISELRKAGIQAGRDISVMGFDNTPTAEYFSPALTTISQPQFDIGKRAMELLLDRIQDPNAPVVTEYLPYRLEIRDSVLLK